MWRAGQASLLLCMVVVWAVYSGNLTASLAVKRIQWPFHDLKGLSEADDYSFVVTEGTNKVQVLKVNIFTIKPSFNNADIV